MLAPKWKRFSPNSPDRAPVNVCIGWNLVRGLSRRMRFAYGLPAMGAMNRAPTKGMMLASLDLSRFGLGELRRAEDNLWVTTCAAAR